MAGLALLAAWTPDELGAQGFSLNEYGACAMARGGATVADACGDGSSIAYNQAIQAEAEARGWAYWNPNPPFPGPGPGPGDPRLPRPHRPGGRLQAFGLMISEDGVHPSTEGHRIVADSLASVIRSTYWELVEPD